MKPVEILTHARDLIADETRWCQGSSALGGDGEWVFLSSHRACRWCATGALSWAGLWAGDSQAEDAAEDLANTAAKEFYPYESSIMDVNDNHDHETIMRVFARAIEIAEEDSNG